MCHVFASRELLRSGMKGAVFSLTLSPSLSPPPPPVFNYSQQILKYLWFGSRYGEINFLHSPFLTEYKNGNQKQFRKEKFSHLIWSLWAIFGCSLDLVLCAAVHCKGFFCSSTNGGRIFISRIQTSLLKFLLNHVIFLLKKKKDTKPVIFIIIEVFSCIL